MGLGSVVVGCSLGATLDDLGMVVFAAGDKHVKVGEDMVLGVATDPGSIHQLISMYTLTGKVGIGKGVEMVKYTLSHQTHCSLSFVPPVVPQYPIL